MSNFKEYWSDKSNNYDYPMPAAKDAWEHQQAQFAELKAQLNNMEQCYIAMKKERDELQAKNEIKNKNIMKLVSLFTCLSSQILCEEPELSDEFYKKFDDFHSALVNIEL